MIDVLAVLRFDALGTGLRVTRICSHSIVRALWRALLSNDATASGNEGLTVRKRQTPARTLLPERSVAKYRYPFRGK